MWVFKQLSLVPPQKTPLRTAAVSSYSACLPNSLQTDTLTPQASHTVRGSRMSSAQSPPRVFFFPPWLYSRGSAGLLPPKPTPCSYGALLLPPVDATSTWLLGQHSPPLSSIAGPAEGMDCPKRFQTKTRLISMPCRMSCFNSSGLGQTLMVCVCYNLLKSADR